MQFFVVHLMLTDRILAWNNTRALPFSSNTGDRQGCNITFLSFWRKYERSWRIRLGLSKPTINVASKDVYDSGLPSSPLSSRTNLPVRDHHEVLRWLCCPCPRHLVVRVSRQA